MKRKFTLLTTVFMLFLMQNVIFSQAPPLGTTASFALFTGTGAFTNDGASVVTGDIGTYTGALSGFPPGVLVGQKHVGDGVAFTAAADVGTAYGFLAALTPLDVIGVGLGGPGEVTLGPGVHKIVAAATLNNTLYLDAGGDTSAFFIFQIDGALATTANSKVELIGSANPCNVYWQINGQFDLETYSVFVGTVIASGPINLFVGSTLVGRGLSTAGAISVHTAVVTVPVCECLLPDAAGTITGNCIEICPGQTGVYFSVPLIPGATGYIWNIPAGATITSGANTNSIMVEYGSDAETGSVTVQGYNACDSGVVSAPYNIAVKPLPATPTVTLIQPTSTLATGTITVTDPAPAYYLVYSINGSDYTNATGVFSGVVPGTYTVTAKILYGCVGLGTIATINDYTTDIEKVGADSKFDVYPNPNGGYFTVFMSTTTEKHFDIVISNAQGSKVFEKKNIFVNGKLNYEIDLSQSRKGMYYLLISSGNDRVTRKVIITK